MLAGRHPILWSALLKIIILLFQICSSLAVICYLLEEDLSEILEVMRMYETIFSGSYLKVCWLTVIFCTKFYMSVMLLGSARRMCAKDLLAC